MVRVKLSDHRAVCSLAILLLKRGTRMRNYLLAAAAATVLASPAVARDGAPYVGIEGGVMWAKDFDVDVDGEFLFDNGETITEEDFSDEISLDHKTGIDLDMIAGYDFGMFRLEGELGWKKANLDEGESEALDDLDDEGFLVDDDFDLDGSTKALSFMVNGLLDFGDEDGLSFYGGLGVGRARVKSAGEKDSAWAWQAILGTRYAISPNIDLGLKYRYFRTGNLDFGSETVSFSDGDILFPDTGTVTVAADDINFKSHSLLASLIFNFAPPPPPAVEPPPPPPPVETPPPPPPAPERG